MAPAFPQEARRGVVAGRGFQVLYRLRPSVPIRLMDTARTNGGGTVEQFHTNWYPQRVRIVALPPDRRLEGFDLSTFEVGQWYRVGERLAELLIVLDYGELEGEDSASIH